MPKFLFGKLKTKNRKIFEKIQIFVYFDIYKIYNIIPKKTEISAKNEKGLST